MYYYQKKEEMMLITKAYGLKLLCCVTLKPLLQEGPRGPL